MHLGNNKNKQPDKEGSLEKVFDLILRQEEQQFISYMHASRCVSNPKARALFKWLSDAEKQHLIYLCEKADRPLDTIEKLEKEMDDDEACYKLAGYLEALDEKSILLFAIKSEKVEIEGYEKSRSGTDDKKAIQLIDEIIREEEGHIYQLEQLFAQLYSRLPSEEDFKDLPPVSQAE